MAPVFELPKTQNAVRMIADLFGGANQERVPAGLVALFNALARLRPNQVGPWSEVLLPKEVDLLAHYHDKAPSAKVQLAIFLLLAHRRDARATGPLTRFFFALPERTLVDQLHKLWPKLSADHLMDRKHAWMCRYFREGNHDAQVNYTASALDKGDLHVNDVFNEHTTDSPLIWQLMDLIFETGSEFITRIQPEVANDLAIRFLNQGHERRVQNFLSRYPVDCWKPVTMEQIYGQKGPPDPITRPFYQAFDTGVIWGIRNRLFTGRMAALITETDLHAFWLKWLYLCQDWRYQNQQVMAFIRPFRVFQTKDKVRVYTFGKPDRLIEEYEGDSWVGPLSELLAECRLA